MDPRFEQFIQEGKAISLCWPDVDFDNLLVRLQAKGRKDRGVPFSFELRRWVRGSRRTLRQQCEATSGHRRAPLGQRLLLGSIFFQAPRTSPFLLPKKLE
jgi:integrase